MKRPASWCLCLVVVIELLIVPILEAAAYILSIISTFEYAESFRTKPEYKYLVPPVVSSTRYVDNVSCSISWSKELVDCINGLNVPYVYTLFVFSIIFNTLSLLMNNTTRIFKYFTDPKSNKLFCCKVISAIITYLALVFSVPALYATKMKYGKCLTVEGIMSHYLTSDAFLFINIGMWSTILLPLGYLCRCWGQKMGSLECGMWLWGLAYLVFALVSKYFSFVFLQFGWDLCLNVELVFPIIKAFPWETICKGRSRVGLLS